LWGDSGGEITGRGVLAASDTPEVNCIQGSGTCAVGTTPFVDPSGGDFHLAPGSLAIDHGVDAAASGYPLDLEGQPRLSGAHVDLGCFETAH
jgi:hypothetical protein